SKSSDFVRDDQYVVSAIDVDVVRKSASDARLRPVSLVLENAAGAVRRLDFAERMALVQEVWNAAARQSSPLSHLAGLHEAAVLSARLNRRSPGSRNRHPASGGGLAVQQRPRPRRDRRNDPTRGQTRDRRKVGG